LPDKGAQAPVERKRIQHAPMLERNQMK